MKKILFSLFFCLLGLSITSRAQVVEKGDKLFGGSFFVSFTNINGSGVNYNSVGNTGVFPSFAWAIKKDLTLGLKGTISYARSAIRYADPNNKNTSSVLSIGPGIYLKKYKQLMDHFGVYFDHGINGYYNVNTQKANDNTRYKTSLWGGSYNFNPGVFYKFSDSFLGEGNIGGVNASYFGGHGMHNTGIGVSFLQYFNIGFTYIIGKKST